MSDQRMQPGGLEAMMTRLRHEFVGKALAGFDELQTLLDGLASSAQPADDVARLEKLAHMLTGGGGTFGWPAISAAAEVIEVAIAENRTADPAALQAQLRMLLPALRDAFAGLSARAAS